MSFQLYRKQYSIVQRVTKNDLTSQSNRKSKKANQPYRLKSLTS